MTEEGGSKGPETADLGIKNMSDEERERSRALTQINPTKSAEETLRRLRAQADKPVPTQEQIADELIEKWGVPRADKEEKK